MAGIFDTALVDPIGYLGGLGGFLGAADHPPCDPGWRAVTDDAGNPTCVQPASGDAGYCDKGQALYVDAQGSPVCYAGTGGSVSPPVTAAPPPSTAGAGTSYNVFSSAGWSGVFSFIQTPAGIATALALLFLLKKKW